jgi:hypothetical protein
VKPFGPLIDHRINPPVPHWLVRDYQARNLNRRSIVARDPGETALKLTDEFRENARACLELARKADSVESEGHWLAMAQYWYDLAEDAEVSTAIRQRGR